MLEIGCYVAGGATALTAVSNQHRDGDRGGCWLSRETTESDRSPMRLQIENGVC